MSGLKSGELFAGVGGLGMAVDEVFNAEPAWFCEFDTAPSRVLAHHFPDVPNFGDVRAVDWEAVERPHILAGGFPCQDVSTAGRRRGLQDGTRSGLWAEFARAIDVLRPDWVVIENVRGLLSADGEPWHPDLIEASEEMKRWARVEDLIKKRMEKWSDDTAYVVRKRGELVRVARQRKWSVARFKRERRLVRRAIDTVLRDLADLGFDAEWTGLRASDVGAPHGRFRVFILAWPRERTVADPARLGRQIVGASGPSAGSSATSRHPDAVADSGNRTGNGERARTESEQGSMLAPDTDRDGSRRFGWVDAGERDAHGRRRAHGAREESESPAQHALMPTPRASGGGSATETMYALGAERVDDERTQGQVTLLPTPTASEGEKGGPNQAYGSGGATLSGTVPNLLPTPMVGSSSPAAHGQISGDFRAAMDRALTDWGSYAPAIARWEPIIGRPAPAPVRFDGKGGKARLNPELTEWMMGWPFGRVTAAVIGLTRQEQLKACGNGVVPQQAEAALDELLARPGVPSIEGRVAA